MNEIIFYSSDTEFFNSEESIDADYYYDDETKESDNDETKESDENIIKCKNYNLCKNLIFTFDNEYCKECFLYFNKKIIYQKDNQYLKTCPICLSNDKSNIIISLYNCDHIICHNCLYNIYWKKTIDDIEVFPYKNIYNLWKQYLNSNISRKLKCFVIYKLVNDDLDDFNENYNNCIKNISLKTIPKIFINKIKEIVFYQVIIEKNKMNNNKNTFDMINSIKNCPYCRKDLH